MGSACAYTSRIQGERTGKTRFVDSNALLEIPVLVTPLGENSERVFKKSDDDEETANGRQVRLQGLGIDIGHIFNFGAICTDLLEEVVWVSRGGRLVAWRAGRKAVGVASVW